MKFSAAFLAISVSSTSAFTANLNKRGSTQLAMAKLIAPLADVSALIDEATKLSQDFGPTSPEARLAWEAVEEVNAADNR